MDSNQLMRDFSLEGKVAIVTGAGRGIGKAIAMTLAEAGADIVAADRTREQIQETPGEIKRLGKSCLAIAADVTSAAQIDEMVKKAISEFGHVDILVNCAGITLRKAVVPIPEVKFPGWQLVTDADNEMSEQEWHHIMDTNLTSAFLCCRTVGPYMIKQRKGKIVNISSTSADDGSPYYSAYNISKAGINMLTRCLAIEWAPFNINVNAIGPGWFPTAMTESRMRNHELLIQMIKDIPLGRTGEVREIGLLATFLASPASDYLTGQTIYLDGGLLAR
jgi:NAD(P)-dependent dehydrogenase (short-subunit alcohol dehydrogenase family)